MLKTDKGYQKAILLVYFVMHYFLFENENKQGFFETLSRQSIVLISSFPKAVITLRGECKILHFLHGIIDNDIIDNHKFSSNSIHWKLIPFLDFLNQQWHKVLNFVNDSSKSKLSICSMLINLHYGTLNLHYANSIYSQNMTKHGNREVQWKIREKRLLVFHLK